MLLAVFTICHREKTQGSKQAPALPDTLCTTPLPGHVHLPQILPASFQESHAFVLVFILVKLGELRSVSTGERGHSAAAPWS